MVHEVGALILFTGRLEETVVFYRALGIDLVQEQHEDGPVHYAAELGATHFAIYAGTAGEAPRRGDGGCSFAGFTVESAEQAVTAATTTGARVLQQPEMYPWGLRAVLEDPDGRPVEIFQRRRERES